MMKAYYRSCREAQMNHKVAFYEATMRVLFFLCGGIYTPYFSSCVETSTLHTRGKLTEKSKDSQHMGLQDCAFNLQQCWSHSLAFADT